MADKMNKLEYDANMAQRDLNIVYDVTPSYTAAQIELWGRRESAERSKCRRRRTWKTTQLRSIFSSFVNLVNFPWRPVACLTFNK